MTNLTEKEKEYIDKKPTVIVEQFKLNYELNGMNMERAMQIAVQEIRTYGENVAYLFSKK